MAMTRRQLIQRQAVAGLSLLGIPQAHSSAQASTSPADMAARAPLPPLVAAPRPDAAELLAPAAIQIQGWLGQRIRVNAAQRLSHIDTVPLLAGFQHKPGSHPWIGEHVGKWMHAATLAWSYTGSTALRAKLDQVAADLIAAQESDGYLGTYLPEKRLGLFEEADWDVWSHKYCLVGLITYHQYTGNAGALQACHKAAALLMATFPAQRSILAAGTHMGMAATSVLEPVVQLYRVTGDARYLQFARSIVAAIEGPDGPRIVTPLLQGEPVTKVANGKAYEMLANLVGLCELARATGEQPWLLAVLNAWQDIVDKRLYVTGTTSQYEHFQADHDLRDAEVDHVGEVCVTTTWVQLNLLLLQITGEARFGNELERTFYNHLTAAQHPAGNDWTYFTALSGSKQYDKGITCCHSSGSRGIALAPQAAYLRGHRDGHDALWVSTFETSSAALILGGQPVTVEQRSGFPYRGEAVLTLRMAQPARFAVQVRAPDWALPLVISDATVTGGWARLAERQWQDGDQIQLRYRLAARTLASVVNPAIPQARRAALAWGPFVLAYDRQLNPGLPPPRALGLASGGSLASAPGSRLRFSAEVEGRSRAAEAPHQHAAQFVTFADAGAEHSAYQVWLRAPGVFAAERPASASLLADGEESRSRSGNVRGSIIDDDLNNLVNTWTNELVAEDWFSVTLEEAVSARRFVFTHGRNYHDGGWFDTEQSKPQVQVQSVAQGPWLTIGVLADYPATTATQAERLAGAGPQQFTLTLPAPVPFVAVRVIGKPASGDRPQQAFVTCAELQAFA